MVPGFAVQPWQEMAVDRVSSVKKTAVMMQKALDLDSEGLVRIHVQLRKELINLQVGQAPPLPPRCLRAGRC